MSKQEYKPEKKTISLELGNIPLDKMKALLAYLKENPLPNGSSPNISIGIGEVSPSQSQIPYGVCIVNRPQDEIPVEPEARLNRSIGIINKNFLENGKKTCVINFSRNATLIITFQNGMYQVKYGSRPDGHPHKIPTINITVYDDFKPFETDTIDNIFKNEPIQDIFFSEYKKKDCMVDLYFS